MKGSNFEVLGRDCFTRILIAMRPIDVIKLCFLTNSQLANDVPWGHLLLDFGCDPEEIPVDPKEQKELYYDYVTTYQYPFYVSVDDGMIEFEHVSKTICRATGLPDIVYEQKDTYHVKKMPTKMKLMGFEFEPGLCHIRKPRGGSISEIIEHPIGDRVVYTTAGDDQDRHDIPYIKHEGEKVWCALYPGEKCLRTCYTVGEPNRDMIQEFFHSVTEELGLNYEKMPISDINKLEIISMCAYEITDKFTHEKPERVQKLRLRVFRELFHNDYFIYQNQVWQIGLVEFCPHTQWFA